MQARCVYHLITVMVLVMGFCMPIPGNSTEPACAENDPDSPACDEPRLEHVLVTATRRESLVEGVPVSMTALSGDRLEEGVRREPTAQVTPRPRTQSRGSAGLQQAGKGMAPAAVAFIRHADFNIVRKLW